jgi:hypothetical protein
VETGYPSIPWRNPGGRGGRDQTGIKRIPCTKYFSLYGLSGKRSNRCIAIEFFSGPPINFRNERHSAFKITGNSKSK